MTTRSYLIAILAIAAWLPIEAQPWQSTALAQRGDSDRDDESRDERRRRWRERWNRDDEGQRSGDDDGRRRARRDRDDDDDESDRDENESTTSSRPAATAASSTSAAVGIGTRNYARSLIAQNDKDGDMMLKGEERSALRGKAAQADGNNDGVITLDEMISTLSSPQPASPAAATPATQPPSEPTPSTSSSESRSNERTDKKENAARRITNGDRKSYRFKSAKERLPSGLPSFFSRDANGDGQIAMHEYSRSWTDRTARDFARYDLNSDGIITPREATKK